MLDVVSDLEGASFLCFFIVVVHFVYAVATILWGDHASLCAYLDFDSMY